VTRQHLTYALVGLLLTAVTFIGVLYQVNEALGAEAQGSLPQLICPLH